jgi:hypothetical protein
MEGDQRNAFAKMRLVVSLCSSSATEHVHATIKGIDLLFLGLLGGLGSGGGSSSATSSRSRASNSEGGRISQEGLEGSHLLEGEGVQVDTDGHQGLEGVADGVGQRGLGGVAHLQGDGSHGGQGTGELGHDLVVIDVQHVHGELRSGVEDAVNLQAVREGLDVELLQQGSLGGAHLVTLLDEGHVVGDFDLALDDLGGDLQDLEKGGLSGVAASGARGHAHIDGGDGADTGRGRHSVGQNEVSDLGQVRVGEDEADVARHLGGQGGVEMAGVRIQEGGQDLAHEGVLAHQDLGLATHLLSGDVHLLGADVVNIHNEHLGVGVQHLGHASEVLGFLRLGKRHFSVGTKHNKDVSKSPSS